LQARGRCCSTDFDPIHAGRFRAGCSISSSPLRLPISPPRHWVCAGAILPDIRR